MDSLFTGHALSYAASSDAVISWCKCNGIPYPWLHEYEFCDVVHANFFRAAYVAIVGCVFSPNLRFYQLHFVMSLVYTVLNLAHLVVDAIIAVPGYQLVLMLLLLLIGLLINLVAYSAYTYMKTNPKSQDNFNSLSSGV
jgi:hypothetical protein